MKERADEAACAYRCVGVQKTCSHHSLVTEDGVDSSMRPGSCSKAQGGPTIKPLEHGSIDGPRGLTTVDEVLQIARQASSAIVELDATL